MNSETSIFDKKTAGVFIIILIIALTARIINLELRPLHHDETVRAFMIQGIANGNPWKHHMGFHGPFLFYANALSFKIFGESTFSLRIAESIFGGLIILLLIPIRSHIGNRGFLFSAALIALSPALVYFSRMTIQTPFILFFELATVVFAFSYSNSKNPIYAYLTAISIALAFTVKETTYVLLGMFGPYLAVKFILSLFGKQGRIRKKTKLFKANLSKWKMRLKNNAPVIISAILLFLVFYIIPYSSFLQELETVKSSLGLFQFWYDRVQYRHTKSVDYYFKIVLDVEFIPVIFAIVGLIYSIFRRNEFRTAVSYWSIAAFSVYSYIPTKEAWVFPHILPPIILLAGIGVEGVYLELTRKKRFAGLGKPVFTIILIYFLAAYGLLAYEKNFVSYSMESNSLTYVQSYPDVEKIVERIENLSFKKTGGRDLDIVYAFEEDYPLRWYLRDYKNVAYYKGPVGGIYGWNGTTWGGEGSISWADDEVQ
ncbi:MAG: flippase activity-associated protein Agl23, partial [Methanobacteriota archaeon]